MTTQDQTSNVYNLARLIVATWVQPAPEYVFDAFGLRKACSNVSDMLLADGYSEKQSEALKAIHEVWGAARRLDTEIESANKAALEIRERLLKALQS